MSVTLAGHQFYFDEEERVGSYQCMPNFASFIGPLAYYVERFPDPNHDLFDVWQTASLDLEADPEDGPFGSLELARNVLWTRVTGRTDAAPDAWATWITNSLP